MNKPVSNSIQTELKKESANVESNIYRNKFRNFKSNGWLIRNALTPQRESVSEAPDDAVSG